MYILHLILVLFLSPSLSKQISTDLTYEELEDLDATCYRLDTCNVRRSSDSLEKYTCQCGSYCSQLETCCIDSPFRDRKAGPRPSCRPVNGKEKKHYFMVDQCSSSNTDRKMEKLCNEEWNRDNNLQPLVPVTSLSSNVTYKNYFCFRCNEATNNYLYWKVRVNYFVEPEADYEETVPTYDMVGQTWMAPINDKDYVPVELEFEVPGDIRKVPNICTTNAISSCSSQWTITDVKRKCSMYTTYVYIRKNGTKVSYKNPHCALCNFESLEDMGCGITKLIRTGPEKPFSFTNLLDINRRDGEKVGMVELCDSKSVWDPFFKKCRRTMCAVPWFVMKDEKCVPP